MTQPTAPFSQPVQIVGPDGIQSEGVNKVAVYFWDNSALEWTKATTGSPVANNVNVNNFPSTYPITAAALPLPAGAASETTLAALNTKAATETTLNTLVKDATVSARLGVLGQSNMAGSAPVVIASNQTSVPANITYADSPNLDPFSRLRTSSAISQLESKFTHDTQPYLHEDLTVGGGTITHVFSEAAVAMAVGTASGDRVVRESHRYVPYVPGNGLICVATGLLGPAKTNVVSRIGIFNDNNGCFFERNATDIRAVIRSNTSGTASDANFATQANWNLDKLNGSGPSGITLNADLAQIFVIDYQWLGLGRVRFGFDFGGHVVYVHEFSGANSNTVVYMRRPTLPVRYEIVNTGTPSPLTASTMKQICYSAKIEGPPIIPGVSFEVHNSPTSLIAVTTRVPILALRLANTYKGNINRRQLRVQGIALYTKTNDCFFEFGHIHSDYTSTTGGSWVAVDTNSAAEVNTGITAITGGTQHSVNPFYIAVGQGQSSLSLQANLDITSGHTWVNQNIDSTKSEIAVIWATSMSNTANVSAAFIFDEIE